MSVIIQYSNKFEIRDAVLHRVLRLENVFIKKTWKNFNHFVFKQSGMSTGSFDVVDSTKTTQLLLTIVLNI